MNGQTRRAARPAMVAAALCSVVCLLVPRPAYAGPVPGQTASATVSPGSSVPDTGVAPVTTNAGQADPAGLPTTIGPLAAEITADQNAVELLSEQVTSMGEDVDAAHHATEAAHSTWSTADDALVKAQQDAADAAARAYQDADSLGPLDGLADDLSGLGVLAPGFGSVVPATPPDPTALAKAASQAQERERAAYAAYHAAQVTEQALTDQQAVLVTARDQRNASLQDLVARNQAAAAAAEALKELRDAALAGQYAAGSNVKGMVANPKAIQALTFAFSQIGKPYAWGAEGPSSYDCSGLVWASYRAVGANLPRVARDQQHALTPVPVDELLPGDLIFFNPTSSTDWSTVSHVGIYYGNNEMIEAPTFGQNVKIAPVWWSAYFSAARVYPAVPAPHPTPTPTRPAAPTPTHTPTPTAPPSSAAPSSGPPSTPSSGPPSSAPPSTAPPSNPASEPPSAKPASSTPTP